LEPVSEAKIEFLNRKVDQIFSTAVPDATLEPDFLAWSGRIVGGSTATPGQFPYQASLRTLANGHFCGGFIINNRWVGSAAHCTVNRNGGNMVVVVGAQNRISGGTTMSVARVINHPNYSASTLANDISVVQTVNAIVESATVRPIPLGSAMITSGTAVASGWGQTSHPGSAAAELQFLSVDVITNEACRSRLSTLQAARILDSTICTSSPTGTGLCMGDSGGPLSQGGSVIGAVSWGIPCGNVQPDMFARISNVRDWMNQAISS
jgi:secreted trypsin-like serine protease